MSTSEATAPHAWPPLPLEGWRSTAETLHRYCQMAGKVRLALAPFQNHWWHVTLRVDARGLTTGRFPVGDGRAAEVRFDLRDHAVELTDSEGARRSFRLRDPFPCAEFHRELLEGLAAIDVAVDIDTRPYDLDGPAFDVDWEHVRYDAEAVDRYRRVLLSSASVLEEFAGWFNGKQSPVHFFWHGFDLALARFSGRRAPVREGVGAVEAEAYSHEVIAFGFWPGDRTVPYPAYYSYTAPAPATLVERPLEPDGAAWDPAAGMAVLPYEAVRTSGEPRTTLLAFLESSYLAGATTAGWDIGALATRAAPPAG